MLVAGALVAPPRKPGEPPREEAAPILEAQVQRREPARVFRAARDAGRDALTHAGKGTSSLQHERSLWSNARMRVASARPAAGGEARETTAAEPVV